MSVGNVSENLRPLLSITVDVKIVEKINDASKNGQVKVLIILAINHHFES